MTAPPLMHGFLRAQFVYLFRTFPLRRSWRHKLWILAEAAQLLVRYGLLRISLRFAGGSGAIDGKTCAVVLLTHNRPQNLTLLARGALGNGFVTKVVVSNSNHDVRIAECSSDSVKRIFEVAAKIRISDLSQVGSFDAVVRSFGGTKRPRIHPLKPALVCASESLPGVALWKSDQEFWTERVQVFENARDA